MTRSALDSGVRRTPASWDTAPVATGGRRRRWPWVTLAVLLVIGLAWALARSRQTLTAPPTSPGRVQAQVEGFDVSLEITTVTATDNDVVFGGRPQDEDVRTVAPAVRQVAQVTATYLDAVFVAPRTRFSGAAVRSLLSTDALASASDVDVAGLGVVGAAWQEVTPGPVAGSAAVLTADGDAVMITVDYDARAQVAGDGGTGMLRQRAVMVFVPTTDGWRAAAADAELTLPEASVGGGR